MQLMIYLHLVSRFKNEQNYASIHTLFVMLWCVITYTQKGKHVIHSDFVNS